MRDNRGGLDRILLVPISRAGQEGEPVVIGIVAPGIVWSFRKFPGFSIELGDEDAASVRPEDQPGLPCVVGKHRRIHRAGVIPFAR